MGLVRLIVSWIITQKQRFSVTWSQLHFITRLGVMLVIARVVFLLINLLTSFKWERKTKYFYSTRCYFSSVEPTQEESYPANSLPSLFPPNQSWVIDIYNGSLATLNSLLMGVDVAMVMMYAPWCIHSASAAKNFLETAKSLEERDVSNC